MSPSGYLLIGRWEFDPLHGNPFRLNSARSGCASVGTRTSLAVVRAKLQQGWRQQMPWRNSARDDGSARRVAKRLSGTSLDRLDVMLELRFFRTVVLDAQHGHDVRRRFAGDSVAMFGQLGHLVPGTLDAGGRGRELIIQTLRLHGFQHVCQDTTQMGISSHGNDSEIGEHSRSLEQPQKYRYPAVHRQAGRETPATFRNEGSSGQADSPSLRRQNFCEWNRASPDFEDA